MVFNDIAALRRKYRQQNNLEPIRAVLGNGSGQVKADPGGDDSLLYVRLRQGEGFKPATTAINEAVLVEAPGMPVILGYNQNNELVVLKADNTSAKVAGFNPGFNNPADGAGMWLDPEMWPQAATFPIDTSDVEGIEDASLEVGAWALRYLWGSDWYDFVGEAVDLTSLLPSAGNWRMVLVYINEDNELDAAGSTEQTLELDPFDLTDAQEAYNAASDIRIPLSFWILRAGATSITNIDKWSDARQFLASGSAGSGVDAELTFGTNLIRNYPSLENADGAQPDWWEETGSGTLTEEGANGEGIPEKYDRVLKFVHSAAASGEYISQQFRSNSNAFTTDYREKALDDNVTKISCSAWVYTADAGTLTLELYDVGASASLGTDTTSTTSTWVYLSIENITFQDQTEYRIYHSANSSTFYVAMPMINVGETVLPWRTRGIRRVDIQYNLESGIDPGGGSVYTDTDGSAGVDAQTVLFELLASYRNTTTQGKVIRIRRDGSAVDASTNNITINQTTAIFTPDFRIVQCSADRIIEYWSNANAGDAESLFLDIAAAWEWE